MLTWYWIDTGWACGGIGVDEQGIIRDGAPIFRRFVGRRRSVLPGRAVRLQNGAPYDFRHLRDCGVPESA